jgi:hypothetical protein
MFGGTTFVSRARGRLASALHSIRRIFFLEHGILTRSLLQYTGSGKHGVDSTDFWVEHRHTSVSVHMYQYHVGNTADPSETMPQVDRYRESQLQVSRGL